MGACCGKDHGSNTLKKMHDPQISVKDIEVEAASPNKSQQELLSEPQKAPQQGKLTITVDEVPEVDEQYLDLTPSGEWPLPGYSVIDLQFNLERDLQNLRDRFDSKYKDLLPQAWEALPSSSAEEDPNCISILQMNMLSDALSTGYERADDGKTFLGVDKDCLRWTYRGLRLIELLFKYPCDIIFLEECDTAEYLGKYLAPRGYKYLHQPKSKSPTRHVAKSIIKERGLDSERFSLPGDGVFIAFKEDRFELIDTQPINDKENPVSVVALAATLKDKRTEREFLAVSTHLKSTKSAAGEQIRVGQIKCLMNDLVQNPNNLPIILGCDLNANPIVNQNGYEPECYQEITTNLGFSSVYVIGHGEEPPYTTWKYREHGTDRHTIDYIFLKDSQWTVSHLLSIPPGDDSSKALIPNWHYPSDHFAIGCKLVWNS